MKLNSKLIYCLLCDGGFLWGTLREIINYLNAKPLRPYVFSARLSTGLLGYTSCSSGNRGPIEPNEVILAAGPVGLRYLVSLGFITCPVCKPEKKANFWETTKETIKNRYAFDSLERFIDKKVLSFDARRIDWELLIPILKRWPSRLYVPKDLPKLDRGELHLRISNLDHGFPQVGYYDHESPNRFTEYKFK